MAYENCSINGGDWNRVDPVESIKGVLEEFPDATVILGGGTVWRKSPRDEEFVVDIQEALLESIPRLLNPEALRGAESVYDLLESRGLV